MIGIASSSKPFAAFEVHLHREVPITCADCALRADEKNRIRTDDASSSSAPSPQASGSGSAAPVMTSSSLIAAPSLRAEDVNKEEAEQEKYPQSSADAKAERTEKKRKAYKADMASLRSQFFGDEPKADGGWAKMKKKTKLSKGSDGPKVLGAVEAGPGPSPYVDRAKARRLAHGPQADQPPPSSFYGPDGRGVKSAPPNAAPRPARPVAAEPAERPDPFAATSKGASMLAKLSGSATSSGPPMLGQLVEARSMHASPADRAGLGSREVVTGVEQVAARSGGSGGDWRESVREASRKRFRDM